MADLATTIKAQNGYTEDKRNCEGCQFIIAQGHHGVSKQRGMFATAVCARNPDIVFAVELYGVCDKWKAQRRKMKVVE